METSQVISTFNVELLAGYVWYVFPGPDAEDDIGFHGLDSPPVLPPNAQEKPGQEEVVPAVYLCDWKDGYLVLTDENEAPTMLSGWENETEVEITDDFTYDDGAWVVKVIYQNSDGEVLCCGYTH